MQAKERVECVCGSVRESHDVVVLLVLPGRPQGKEQRKWNLVLFLKLVCMIVENEYLHAR